MSRPTLSSPYSLPPQKLYYSAEALSTSSAQSAQRPQASRPSRDIFFGSQSQETPKRGFWGTLKYIFTFAWIPDLIAKVQGWITRKKPDADTGLETDADTGLETDADTTEAARKALAAAKQLSQTQEENIIACIQAKTIMPEWLENINITPTQYTAFGFNSSEKVEAPLIFAAICHNNPNIVYEMIKANPDIRNTNIRITQRGGPVYKAVSIGTPLEIATKLGHKDVSSVLRGEH